METAKNSDTGESKESKQSSNTQNNNSGFDFSQLLNDKNIAEMLKHLLSGGGAMAGSYLIWVKPLQDKLEALTKTIEGQEKRIKELEEEQEKTSDYIFHEQNHQKHENINNMGGTNADYFNLNKNKNYTGEFKRSRRVHL